MEGYDLVYMVYSMTFSLFIMSLLFFYFTFRKYSIISFYIFISKYILTIFLAYISLQTINSFDYQIQNVLINSLTPIYISLFYTILKILLFNISILTIYQLLFANERPIKSLFYSLKVLKRNALKRSA